MPQRKRVSLASGQPARLDIRLHQAPILAGRAVDVDKNPVAGVFVRARKQGYYLGRPGTLVLSGAVTNALGEFRIVVAGAGAFTVDVETKHRRFQALPENLDPAKQQPVVMDTRTYYPGSTFSDGASPVTLRLDEVVEGLEITMLRGPTVCVAAKVTLPATDAAKPCQPHNCRGV